MPASRRIAVVLLLGALVAACAGRGGRSTADEVTAEAEGLALEVAQIIEPDVVGIGRTVQFGCVEDTRDRGVETHVTVDGIPTRPLITGPVVGLLEERGFGDFTYGPDAPDSILLKATGSDFTVELMSSETTIDIVVITRGCTIDG